MLPWGCYRWQNFPPLSSSPLLQAIAVKKKFPVSHPNLAFLYQFDFFQLVLGPIMHEILAPER
jgi:hypothetical protein